MHMKNLVVVLLLLLLAPVAPADPKPVDPAVNPLLDVLNAAGKNLNDFSADVSLTKTDILGKDSTQFGKVFYQTLKDGDTRIRVTFDRKRTGDVTVKQPRDFLLQKGELIDRDDDRKQETTRQVLKPGEKLNPLKLGEGPFPLPIGQDREEVLKNFDVTHPAVEKDDPADSDHLSLVPRPGTRFFKKFATIDVFVGRKQKFPVRIVTVDKGGSNEAHTTDLSNLKINAGLKDSDFTLPPLNAAWRVETIPLSE
jgi:outer membrane lipoprotein-sorting protein